MSYQEAEKQRKIDNKNLMKRSFKSEIKNQKFSWMELFVNILIFIGATILTAITTTYLNINSKYYEFIIECILIIVLSGIKQFIKKEDKIQFVDYSI